MSKNTPVLARHAGDFDHVVGPVVDKDGKQERLPGDSGASALPGTGNRMLVSRVQQGGELKGCLDGLLATGSHS